MKNLKIFALSALSLFGFAACQQVEIAPDVTPEATHTVTFVAGAPETKTTVSIEGNTATFAWTKSDESRFTLYENGTEANETIGVLDNDGKMTIMATFEGSAPDSPSYQALYNTAVKSTQTANNLYDETSDVLVSAILNDSNRDAESYSFRFKRESAIAKMTLKGLDKGLFVSSVTIESDKAIAGTYDLQGASFTSTSNKITINALSEITSGAATIWFTTIPVEGATFTITATTVNNKGNVVGTYTKTFTKTISLTRGDVTSFGVAMEKGVVASPNETYNRITSQSELKDGEYVIGMALNSAPSTIKYLVNTTKEKPGCTDITGDISISNDGKTINLNPTTITNAKWLIESVEGGFSISSMTEKPAGLATTSDNNGLTTQPTYLGKAWSITVNGETNACTMKYVPTSRYLNVYSLTNPRTYTSSTTNNNGKIYLYKKYDPRTSLTTPTNLEVSAEKVVSWDAVDGAAFYVLTIGTEDYPCLSNSYNASAIADEYYDVAVVAVPEDTENYKNSAAATLTDAKFGTPKLPTPIISAGVLEETSVAFSWKKDARATNGYHWALYNGEALVQEATETLNTSAKVTGLTFGTTYTAKVYALAVDGEKPYVQSDTAPLDLATKEKTTISTIVAAGTGETKYSISDLTVMAVSGKYFVVKDDTGIMTAYKSTNATANVGDIATLQGTYGTTDGLNLFTYTSYSKGDGSGVVDHGTPYTLNADNIANYTINSSLKYVKATVSVSSDGKSLTIGSTPVYLRPSSGISVSEYAGRTITLMGYAFGYDTNFNNVVILGTSVELDQTAPYLSVDPTSKTWASDNTDPAVFTVTTNTESVKDWSVSPTALDWATIAIDKNAGTITVTPNGTNTTKDAHEATLTVTHAANNNLSKEITLTQKGAGKVEKTATITFGTNSVKINSANVTAKDDCNNPWTIETVISQASFTQQPTYSQVGSGSKPATSITFTTTLPSDAEVGSIEAKFGGFSGTAGSVSLKVGNASVGSGSLNASNDVTVSSTSTAAGNVVTVSITNISKGVKCYYIKVGYKTAK